MSTVTLGLFLLQVLNKRSFNNEAMPSRNPTLTPTQYPSHDAAWKGTLENVF